MSNTKTETVKTKTDTQFLDSIDEKSKLIFDRIYIVLAFWAILAPIMATVFSAIGLNFDIILQQKNTSKLLVFFDFY